MGSISHSREAELLEKLGKLAHDLNNPLAVIQLRTEQIQNWVKAWDPLKSATPSEKEELLRLTGKVLAMCAQMQSHIAKNNS